jgi:uncharacterized protein YutE (UPF0331/DUF86 family)
MTPGTIDLKVVSDRLDLVREHLGELRELPSGSMESFLADRRNQRAAEALLRRAIEALFDVARHLLAKSAGVGALEYREVARQCVQRGLVRDPDLATRMEQIAGFRNRLTHHYEDVTGPELYGVVAGHLGDLAAIAEELRRAAAELTAPPTPDAAP